MNRPIKQLRAGTLSVTLILLCAIFGSTFSSAMTKAAAAQAEPNVPVLKGIDLPYLQLAPDQVGTPAMTAPQGGSASTASQLGGNLTYHGGPIQHDPEVYVLFWGSWWLSTCNDQQGHGAAAEDYLYKLYNGLGSASDSLSPILSEYYGADGTGPTFPTAAGSAFITWNADCTNPPATSTYSQLATKAVAYAHYLAKQGYRIGNNTQIVVVSPSGVNAGGAFGALYCSSHTWAEYSSSQLLSWTNLPFIPDAGSKCGARKLGHADDGWSIVAGHEYSESITDPFIGSHDAWLDSIGNEVGDKCIWTKMFMQKMSTGSFAMQSEWENLTSSCQDIVAYPNVSS